jgi:prevent-host-death family protein
VPNPKPKRNPKPETAPSPELGSTARAAQAAAGAVRQATVHEAKTNLSRLLKAVESGATVVIARGATPIARLVSMNLQPGRHFGRYKGLFEVGPEFFEPLPEDELQAWEGG